MSQQHIIKRQILEIQTPDNTDVRKLQVELSDIYQREIVPLLDLYCSELSEPGQILRIDLLEIDVGTLPLDNLREAFVTQLRTSLRSSLQSAIRQQTNGKHPTVKSQLELLAIFCTTGSIPWWADHTQADLLVNTLELLLTRDAEALRRFIETLGNRALLRLINHYNDENLLQIIGLFYSGSDAPLSHFSAIPHSERQNLWLYAIKAAQRQPIDDLSAFFDKAISRFTKRGQLSADEMQALHESIEQNLNEFAQQITYYPDFWRVLITLAQQLLVNERFSIGALTDIQDYLTDAKRYARFDRDDQQAMQQFIRDLLQRLMAILPQSVAHDWLQAIQQTDLPDTFLSDLTAGVSDQSRTNSMVDLNFSDAQELYIQNSGLVILWVFLQQLFRHMDLLDEKTFVGPHAQHRAAALLQYIASGERQFPEYLLPLNKVLCGLELTDVFDMGVTVSDEDAIECDNFVTAVIEQAPILRSMSIAGFRGTFLLRNGRLSSRDGAWLLQVESQSYDIVLGRFPWSWNWVKLPWMTIPLQVEWS